MIEVSIIVPVYRAEDSLERCVRSICAQTVKAIEIILVDDGNTDRSGELCDMLRAVDDRIQVIHQSNAGPAAARNAGLAIARGKWVTFCDADDEMLSEACEKYLARANAENADVVIADIYRKNATGMQRVRLFDTNVSWKSLDERAALIAVTMCYQMNLWPCRAPARFGYGSPCNKLISMQLIRDNGIAFPKEIRQYEDRLFNMIIFMNSKQIAYLPEPVYVYYATEQSLTHALSKDLFELNDRIFRMFEDFVRNFGHNMCDRAMNLVVCERFYFAVRNIVQGKLSVRELCLICKEIRRQRNKSVYKAAFRNADFSCMRKIDKVMLTLLRHYFTFTVSVVCHVKSRMKG